MMGYCKMRCVRALEHSGKESAPQTQWLKAAVCGYHRNGGGRWKGAARHGTSSGSAQGMGCSLREAQQVINRVKLKDLSSLGRIQPMAAELKDWGRIQSRKGNWQYKERLQDALAVGLLLISQSNQSEPRKNAPSQGSGRPGEDPGESKSRAPLLL